MPCMKESSAITRKNPPKLLFEHGKSWEERSSRQPRNKAPIQERDGAAAWKTEFKGKKNIIHFEHAGLDIEVTTPICAERDVSHIY